MSAVLFAPHNDDETLFAFYQILRHRPKVIIVLRSFKEAAMGGPDYVTREHETELAMAVAGVEWEQWGFSDLDPDWATIIDWIGHETIGAETVIAPAWELGGHEHHNEIGEIVRGWAEDSIAYTSYVRGQGRTETPSEVVPTAAERLLKDVALACYQSQRAYPPTAPWFDPADQREFVL
jgi:LmbE family N-acetylglucosaminyl deacetylase